MAIFKCKMCGGALEINNNETVVTCEYCGTQQTLPRLDDERRANLYDRANHFRRNNEFDKAMGIYEQILNEDKADAEAYWSIVLCRYGIEYVEDPASHKRIPTINRAQFTSIFDDDNYKSALQYADGYQRNIYEEEAKAINEIQKGILAISQKEEPFDVFICYKETDSHGRRTPDSVLANDLYHQLTQEGFKVFFSRITLEDKLGVAYEPYIFAALNSAKVMVVLGTKPEYFNAVWVKNEWSRFLAMIKGGAKKILIPAYKDMDPYDLPEEFSHLQAQDMSKLGFMQDLIRGIKKIAQADIPKTTVVKETVISGGNANTAPLLKRAFMFLEDGDWKSADEYCEKVLDIDPECAEAYLGKLMAKLQVKTQKALKDRAKPFDTDTNYQKAVRFANDALRTTLTGYINHINTRNENARLNDIYTRAKEAMAKAATEDEYKEAARLFEMIPYYKDSDILAKKCLEIAKRAEEEKKKCDLLFEEYKAAIQNEKSATNKKAEASNTLASLTLQHNALSDLKKNWHSIENELLSLDEKLKSIQAKIASLNDEKSNLSFFAGKQKKELAKKISALEDEQQSIRGEIISTQKEKLGYSTISEVDRAIHGTIQQMNVQKKVLESLALARSSQIVRKELIQYEYGNDLLHPYKNSKIGDYITFGAYTQDNNASNGKEDIEWLILDVQDGKALVISKYALDCKPYNRSYYFVTWETCTLRKWLNSNFINSAFTADEKAMIPTVTVSADKNPKYSTDPGNATQDQVFLLSITEANRYFSSNSARQCEPTDFAIANGAWRSDNGNCCWWLRSPGDHQKGAARVNHGGDVDKYGNNVDLGYTAVRPALWVELSKIGE